MRQGFVSITVSFFLIQHLTNSSESFFGEAGSSTLKKDHEGANIKFTEDDKGRPGPVFVAEKNDVDIFLENELNAARRRNDGESSSDGEITQKQQALVRAKEIFDSLAGQMESMENIISMLSGANETSGTDVACLIPRMCTTPSCVQLSSQTINSIDTAVDPCDNFYQYACGKWMNDHPTSPAVAKDTFLGSIDAKNTQIVRKILSRNETEWTTEAEMKAWNFLQTCQNGTAADEALAEDTIFRLLEEVKIEGSGTDWTNEHKERLFEVIAISQSRSDVVFFDIDILPDDKDSSKIGVYLVQGGLGLSSFEYKDSGGGEQDDSDLGIGVRAMYSANKHWLARDHESHIRSSKSNLYSRHRLRRETTNPAWVYMAAIGADDQRSASQDWGEDGGDLDPEAPFDADASEAAKRSVMAYQLYMKAAFEQLKVDGWTFIDPELADKVYEFEETLAKLFVDIGRDPLETYNPIATSDLTSETGDFLEFGIILEKIFGESVDNVVLETPEYFKGMVEAIEETPIEVINAYVQWATLRDYMKYLGSDYNGIMEIYVKTVTGVEQMASRTTQCLWRTDTVFGWVTGKKFVEESFDDGTKKFAETFMESLVKGFKDNLETIDWMSEETREKAIEKADKMTFKIGYPKWMMKEKKLAAYYEDLNVTSSYFDNMHSYFVWLSAKGLAKYGKDNERDWTTFPTTVNAFYHPSNNEFVFPVGIMQPPLFKVDLMWAALFGGLGAVVGHEITHGFDDSGSNYDGDGNLNPWINEEDKEKFDEETQCFVNQYAEFEINGDNVDGNKTLGENIADNGGLHLSYKAYEDWIEANGDELPLPGRTDTPMQTFFISYGRLWCASVNAESQRKSIKTDVHSPYEFRVNAVLQNTNEFSEAFECREGTFMNPEKKCKVWY